MEKQAEQLPKQAELPDALGSGASILHDAHEAVTPRPESRGGRFNKAVTWLAFGAAAFGGGKALVSPETARANEVTRTEITDIETNAFGQTAHSRVTSTEMDQGRVTFLGWVNAKGTKDKFKRRENCYWDRDGLYNSGVTIHSPNRPRRVQDVAWFYDTRPTRVCRVPRSVSPTGLIKVGPKDCGNFVMDTPPRVNLIKQKVIMVRNLAKARIKVEAHSKAEARAECRSADGLAMAWAYGLGKGFAADRVRVRLFARAKGRGRVVSRISGEAEAEAKSSATADAKVKCESKPQQPPPKQPPPPEEQKGQPPSVDLIRPQHLTTDCQFQFTAYETDPDNDIVFRKFEETGNGNFISFIFPGNEPGEWHIRYGCGTEPEEDVSVTFTSIDSENNSDSDTEVFDVEDGPFITSKRF